MNRNHSPFRYLPWQARDVAASALALFVIVTIGLLWVMKRLNGDSTFDADGTVPMIIGAVLTVAILFAAGGVAGTDITRGFYRAWFSTPMSSWWHYLQRWLLGGLAVMLIPLMLGLGAALTFGNGTGLSGEIFALVALTYLLIGGLVLLMSAFTSRDWLVAFLVVFLQARLNDAVNLLPNLGREIPPAVKLTWQILPPLHLTAVGGEVPTGGDLFHVLAYGLGMVVLALLIFRYRPLGSGGRA